MGRVRFQFQKLLFQTYGDTSPFSVGWGALEFGPGHVLRDKRPAKSQ